MTDRPIIFSAPMIRALLAGRKTQTRRLATSPLVKCVPGDRLWVRETWKSHSSWDAMPPRDVPKANIFYRADDRYSPSGCRWRSPLHMPRWGSRMTLVVTDVRRQTLQEINEDDARAEGCEVHPFPGPWWQGYRDDGDGELMHQEAVGDQPPNWMIDPKPMCSKHLDRSARDAFRALWMDLHDIESWRSNPDIVALTFTTELRNIDEAAP